MEKEKKTTEELVREKALVAWKKGHGLTDGQIEEWKGKYKGTKLITIYPYDEGDLQDAVRFLVRPLLRKEMELIAQKANNGQNLDIRLSNKMTLNYCVLAGDNDRLEEAPVYTGLLTEIGEMNQAKSTERGNL